VLAVTDSGSILTFIIEKRLYSSSSQEIFGFAGISDDHDVLCLDSDELLWQQFVNDIRHFTLFQLFLIIERRFGHTTV
jgi:hypothetical protein